MIIGISGKFLSGKDTAAAILKQASSKIVWDEKKFAKALKEAAAIITGHEDQWSQEGKATYLPHIEMTAGQFQQKVGEGLRDIIRSDIWIVRALLGYDPKLHNWLVTDLRYPNEADYIRSLGGIILRLNASYPGYAEGVTRSGRDTNHVSEVALDNYPDFEHVINNNGTEEDFERKVIEFHEQFIENR